MRVVSVEIDSRLNLSEYFHNKGALGMDATMYYRCRVYRGVGISSWCTTDFVDIHQLAVL